MFSFKVDKVAANRLFGVLKISTVLNTQNVFAAEAPRRTPPPGKLLVVLRGLKKGREMGKGEGNGKGKGKEMGGKGKRI